MKRSILFLAGVLPVSLINITTFAACPSAGLTGDCRVDLEDFAKVAADRLVDYEITGAV